MVVMEEKAQVFDLLFALKEDTYYNEDKHVTLLDIKENLKVYSLSKLRSLFSVLIDPLYDVAKDKENLKKVLEKYEKEVIELSFKVDEITNEKTKIKKDLSMKNK